MATRLNILYLAADESISGWEFLLLIPKYPQTQPRLLNEPEVDRLACVCVVHFSITTGQHLLAGGTFRYCRKGRETRFKQLQMCDVLPLSLSLSIYIYIYIYIYINIYILISFNKYC